MRLAYSYIRFSSKKQASGDSKRRQSTDAEKFCKRHNLKLSSQSFSDLGISAWKGQNFDEGALGAFLEAVKSGLVPQGAVLVVESLDRISRKVARKALRIVEEIIEEGVTIATLSPERFYDEKSLDDLPKNIAIVSDPPYDSIGIELEKEYYEIAQQRIEKIS